MQELEGILTVKETANYLRLSEFTVYRLAKAGQIPCFKVGGSLRFRKDILDRWAERQVTGDKLVVLVVDDEESVRTALTDIIRREGHQVVAVATGEKAIGVFEQGNFGLVFLDIILPGISGTEVFKHIKATAPATPVVIITGYEKSQQTLEALSLGPLILIRKPFQVADIRQLLAMFTRKEVYGRAGMR